MSPSPALVIKDLRTYFYSTSRQAFVRAVDGVDLSIEQGKTLGIVGESGSGKSMTMLSVIGLVGAEPGIISGEINFNNGNQQFQLLKDLPRFTSLEYQSGMVAQVRKDNKAWDKCVEKIMGSIRGREISMIFQNPKNAFNPFMSVGEQIVESILLHTRITQRNEATELAIEWLSRVLIDLPKINFSKTAEAMSGGMSQRAMIALALSCEPSLIIADEPTTGLDATIQARIIELLFDIKTQYKTTMVLISHDIKVISSLADDVAVMYGGTIMESGIKQEILGEQAGCRHPYTEGLLGSIPSREIIREKKFLKVIPGDVVDIVGVQRGCRFYSRCTAKTTKFDPICVTQEPPLFKVSPQHKIRCWLFEQKAVS